MIISKKTILYGLVIFLIPLIVYGLDECQRVTLPEDIPCDVISTWRPQNCALNVNHVDIYNESDDLIQSVNWTNRTTTCVFVFNHTPIQTYTYNSTVDSGVIVVEEDNMWLLALLLAPLGLSFLFLYWGHTLTDEQEPMKWFMRFLSLLMIFGMFVGFDIILTLNNTYSGFKSLFNIQAFSWVFYTLIGIFLIYFIGRIFGAVRQKGGDDLELGRLK